MEITQRKEGWSLRKQPITTHTLDKSKVAEIRDKCSTDIDAIRLFDQAMAIKTEAANVEKTLRTLKAETCNRVSTPDMVVVIDAPHSHDKNDTKKITGGAHLTPSVESGTPTPDPNAAPSAANDVPVAPFTEMRAQLYGSYYQTSYHYIGTAEAGGKTVGGLYRTIQNSSLREAVFHTDGSISVTTTALKPKDLEAHVAHFLPSVHALQSKS